VSLVVALPFLIPMIAGALSLVFWPSRSAQRWLALLGTAGQLAAGVVLMREVLASSVVVLHAGAWPAPYGITLVADTLSAVMVLLTGITGVATALYSLTTIASRMERNGYYPLMHLLLAGVSGAFLTGDLFNLYVWFEVLLLASFALLAMGQERAQMAGALKYVVLNLFSSAMFLTALGLLYGLAGTMNMADLAVKIPQLNEPDRITLVAMLFMLAFAIKAAAFPLFFWLPASYHTPPVAVSALFAGLLTKVGIYSLLRCFTLIFTADTAWTHGWLAVTAAASMLVGVIGAVAQQDLRRMLAFLHVGQLGYMMMGLAINTRLALTGAVIYIAHHIIMKSNLFFIAGAIYRDSGTYRLDQLGGYWRARPALSLLFLVPALAQVGIPPLSGFWAKFVVIKAGVLSSAWPLVAAALVAAILTLYGIIRIWSEVFWKAAPVARHGREEAMPLVIWVVCGTLALMTVAMGLAIEPLWAVADRAAGQLLDPAPYIEAVLGRAP
jgi:multicomponent Na+:H+ antiporter subunit D